jgi:uncharacterized protein
MAKQGYPGLVLVPPSDRSVFRRRLVRWALLVIAVAWGASASSIWLPSSDNNRDCQTGIEQGASSTDIQKVCDQSERSETESPSGLDEFTVAQVSQDGSLAGSHRSIPIPNTLQLAAEHNANHKSMTPHYGSAGRSLHRAMSPSSEDGSAASRAIKKTASSLSPDARLAEQGDAFAQYRLGRFYAQLGGPHKQESLSWFVKASDGLQRLAETGNGEAMYVLGVMYAFGRGVAKDREQARLWLTQAVDQEISAAHLLLAKLDKRRPDDPR